MDVPVEHRPEAGRFEADIGGQRAVIEYSIDAGVMTLTHTEVAQGLEGRGIGGELVKAALEHARAEGLKVQPSCSYARAWMERHPDTRALRA